jgi:hypothetical protein
MRFDWERFLTAKGIPFATRGHNVARGNVTVHCPFCGASDTGQHMGINLENGFWGCWRDSNHRGKSPVKLIAALTGLSIRDAQEIAGVDAPMLPGEMSRARGRLETLVDQDFDNGKQTLKLVKFNSEFFQISTKDTGHRARFCDYLRGRGFSTDELPSVIKDYGLRGACSGPFSWRLIFPIYTLGKQLIGWTGRAIQRSEIRYKAYPSGDGVKRVLYNLDKAAEGGVKLFLVEGPMDALRFDSIAGPHGHHAVASMGTALTAEQLVLLARVSERYEETVLFLDDDALSKALFLKSSLPIRNLKVSMLPVGAHDPGELNKGQILKFCR